MKINLYLFLLLTVFLSGCMSSNLSSVTGISTMSSDSSVNFAAPVTPSASSGGTGAVSAVETSLSSVLNVYYWEIINTAFSGVHTLILSDRDHSSVVEVDFYSQEGKDFPSEQSYSVLTLEDMNRLFNAIAYEGEDWSLIEGRAGVTLYLGRDKTLFTTGGSIGFTSDGIELDGLRFKEYGSEGYIEGTERVFSGTLDFKCMEEVMGYYIS